MKSRDDDYSNYAFWGAIVVALVLGVLLWNTSQSYNNLEADYRNLQELVDYQNSELAEAASKLDDVQSGINLGYSSSFEDISSDITSIELPEPIDNSYLPDL